jgi:hypothetical protein
MRLLINISNRLQRNAFVVGTVYQNVGPPAVYSIYILIQAKQL